MSFGEQDPRQRQRMLLWVLGILLLIFAWHYLPALFRSGSVGGDGGDGGRAIDAATLAVLDQEIVELRLGLLETAASQYEPGRNIFSLAPPKPKPPPPRPAPPPPPRAAATGPPPPPKPQPPPVDVSLMGILGPERRRVAVLSDEETIINALEGDVVKEKFIVHRIGYESVDLRFVGFPDVAPARIEVGG